MTVIQGIILGLIQGFAEPIPVSSSAQTQIASFLMGIETPGIVFEVFLNFASFLAILWLTRVDVWNIVLDFFKYIGTKRKEHLQNFKVALYVVVGTLPVMVTGFKMQDIIDNFFEGVHYTAIFLIITGIFLYLVKDRKGFKDYSEMTFVDAIIIGSIQALLAVIPGISRSGATIVTALFLGLNRETSFKFSFLLYLPIGLGSMILGVGDLMESSHFQGYTLAYILMFVAAFFATLVGYKVLKAAVEKGKLAYFSVYCWVVGTILLIAF